LDTLWGRETPATTDYWSERSDAEWELLPPLLPPPAVRGRPRRHSLRQILNALLYVVRAGGPWRLLPHDLPPWKTVYQYCRPWRLDGTGERIHTALREHLRLPLGRDPQPSAGLIDSQSVKTTRVGGVRGYDGGKQTKGCKRHLLVETDGLLLAVRVHSAGIMDRDGVTLVLADPVPARCPRRAHVWLDAGYTGRGKGKEWLAQTLSLERRDRQTPATLQEGLGL